MWLVLQSCGRLNLVLGDSVQFGWSLPVLYCSGRFWQDLWIDFGRSALILILHDVMASSR